MNESKADNLLNLSEHRLSPLLMITQDPTINEFLTNLATAREEIMKSGDKSHTLTFSRANIVAVQRAYARIIRQGEASLHRLCELIADSVLEGEAALQSVVIGEVELTGRRFKLSEQIRPEELYIQTDLQLGMRQLDRLTIDTESGPSSARLISNSVEYQPLKSNEFAIHKIISRIKAEEELWNKVCDELFNLDQIVQRDKKLRRLGRFVKDVFGVKFIVEDIESARNLFEHLAGLEWSDEELARRDVPPEMEGADKLELVEVKDYLSEQKRSGWGALKAVFQWCEKTFEFQIQTANSYHRELLYLTRESHAGHKQRRESLRREIGQEIPLFAFYLDLLRWLFVAEVGDPPTMEGVTVEMSP